MYEDKKVSTNWVKIGLRIISVILLVLIAYKVVDIVKENQTNVVEKDKMKEKITLLENAGKTHFTSELLPKETGSSATVTLEELIKEELIEEIKDTKDNACKVTEYHVKVIRLDSEYQFKSTLKCSEYEDYLNSFVEIKSDNNEDNNNATIKPTEPITTTTTTTKRVITTSKKKTTQVRKYTVSFNTNGGSAINDQKITSGNVIISPGAPKRSGYTFVGWYYHGQPFDLNTKINQDYVLVAKWIKN